MKKLCVLFLMIASCVWLYAKDLEVFTDWIRSYEADNLTKLEIFYRIDNHQLSFQPVEGNDYFQATLLLGIEIQDRNGKVLAQQDIPKKIIAPNRQETTNQNQFLLDKEIIDLPSGEYTVIFQIHDEVSDMHFEEKRAISTLAIESFCMSDVSLASFIEIDTLDAGALQIIPNPMAKFGQQFPSLYYYYEVYNIPNQTADETYTFTETVEIRSLQDSLIVGLSPRPISGNSGFLLSFGMLSVLPLPNGTYRFHLTVENEDHQLLQQNHIFYVSNLVPTKADYEKRFALMDIDADYELIQYFLHESQKALWKELDDAGRGKFLERFWAINDPDRSTEQNEFRRELERRQRHVLNTYKTLKKKGTETDRGLIYMKYGDPTEVKIYNSDMSKKPQVVWVYGSNDIFIFVDTWLDGDYELVYSSEYDEYTIPDWLRYVSWQLKSDFGLDE